MNGTRYAQALADSYGASTGDTEVKIGAGIKSPIKVIADQQYRSLYPLLYATSDGTVLGQGSSADWLSISTYSCPNPTGNDLSVTTPIYTPQQWDSIGLPIDGSPNPMILSVDVQNIDLSPGNSVAVGIKGKAHRRLPFINRLAIGRGVLANTYAFYDYKDPPKDSKYLYTPPQGKNAPGTTYKATGKLDDVVNRPEIAFYSTDGFTWDAEDADGFQPAKAKIGHGLKFGSQDANDEKRRPIEVDTAALGFPLKIEPGPAITIDPPSPPSITGSVASGGSVDVGNHEYALTVTTATPAESDLSPSPSLDDTAGNQTNQITVPPSPDLAENINGGKLYRTKVVDTVETFYLAHTFTRAQLISGITYNDTVADASLGTAFTTGDASIISVDLAKGQHDGWAYGTHYTFTLDTDLMSGIIESDGNDGKGLSWNIAQFLNPDGSLSIRNTGLSKWGGYDGNGASVQLAYTAGKNVSGMVENAGDSINGLQVCFASSSAATLRRDPVTGCIQVVGLTSAPPGSNPGDGSGGTNGGGNGGVPPNTSQPPNTTKPNPSGPNPSGTPDTPGYSCDSVGGQEYGGYSWVQAQTDDTIGSIFSGAGATHQGKGGNPDFIYLMIPPGPGDVHTDAYTHVQQRFVMFQVQLVNSNTNSWEAWRYFAGPDYGGGHAFGTAIAGLNWFMGTRESPPTADRWQFRDQAVVYDMNHSPGTTAWCAFWMDCNGHGHAAIGASRDTLYCKVDGLGSPFVHFNSSDTSLWVGADLRIGFEQGGIENSGVLGHYANISGVFVADAFPSSITLRRDDTGAVIYGASEPSTPPTGIPTTYTPAYDAGYAAFLASTANICPYTDPDAMMCVWWHAGWVDAYNNNVWAPPALPMPGGSDSLLGIVSGPAGVPVSVP